MAGLFSGCVVDEAGRPVAGARVYYLSAPVATPDVALLTGTDGTFVLSAPVDGRYRVGATADDGATGAAEVELQGDAAADVRVVVSGG